MRSSILAGMLLGLGGASTSGLAQPACPSVPADVHKANAAAQSLFEQRAIRPGGAASKTRPPGMESALVNGARGDGVADDTQALQAALKKRGAVWLETGRVFRITRRLELGTGAALVSDGTATILLSAAAGAFDNTAARRSDAALYGERGAGLRVSGERVTLSDFFLVKEYADGKHVIGIDVVSAADVVIRRVRLRGFSLAPGIVSIRSSDNVEVSSSLVQGCSRVRPAAEDPAAAPVTGIAVDDERVGDRASSGVQLRNNVIDVRMHGPVARGNPSDGIRMAAIGGGKGSAIVDNDIQGADEALDLAGQGIEVRGNRLTAAGRALRLADGARNVAVIGNEFKPGSRGHAIALQRARPPEGIRQVKAIRIERNRFQLRTAERPGVLVEDDGEYSPTGISLRDNQFLLGDCRQVAVQCSARQCTQAGNDIEFLRNLPKCK